MPEALSRSRRDSVRGFFSKAFFTIADQSFFSGANFVVNLLLARWLTSEGYGAFSLAYSIFLLVLAAYMALLIEPMVIYGAGRYERGLAGYVRTLLRMHAAASVATAVLLALAAAIALRFYSREAGFALLGLAVGGGLILLYWLVRRIFYVVADPSRSVIGSALYFVALVSSVALLKAAGALTAAGTLIGMGVASLVTSLVLLWIFRRNSDGSAPGPDLREAVREHWRYGRWAMASAAIAWFPGQIYYAILPAWLGLGGAGALRALMNFAMPVAQSVSALNLLLLPALVRDRQTGGRARMRRTIGFYLAVFTGGCFVYLLALWLARAEVFQFVYKGRYAEYSGLPFLLAALAPVGTCVSAVLGNALRALERSDYVFRASAASAAAAAVVGIPLTALFGVTGALVGIHLSSFVLIAVFWWYWRFSGEPAQNMAASLERSVAA